MAKQDIKPYEFTSDQSRSEAAKNGKKGGVASGAARRKRKSMREALDMLLTKNIKTNQGNMETIEAIMVAAVAKAIKGDIRATEFIRDTIGENPSNKTQFVDDEGNGINPFEVFYKALCEKKDWTR